MVSNIIYHLHVAHILWVHRVPYFLLLIHKLHETVFYSNWWCPISLVATFTSFNGWQMASITSAILPGIHACIWFRILHDECYKNYECCRNTLYSKLQKYGKVIIISKAFKISSLSGIGTIKKGWLREFKGERRNLTVIKGTINQGWSQRYLGRSRINWLVINTRSRKRRRWKQIIKQV